MNVFIIVTRTWLVFAFCAFVLDFGTNIIIASVIIANVWDAAHELSKLKRY